MKSKREKGKKRVDFWLTEAEIGSLDGFCRAFGKDRTEVMRLLLQLMAPVNALAELRKRRLV